MWMTLSALFLHDRYVPSKTVQKRSYKKIHGTYGKFDDMLHNFEKVCIRKKI